MRKLLHRYVMSERFNLSHASITDLLILSAIVGLVEMMGIAISARRRHEDR